MAQSTTVQMTGVLVASPATPSLYSCTLQELINLSFCATYGATKNGVVTVNGTTMSPDALPFEGIVRGRVLALRLLSGPTITVNITTGLGVATFPVSGLYLIHNPNPGDEITAISFATGGNPVDISYVLIGDVT